MDRSQNIDEKKVFLLLSQKVRQAKKGNSFKREGEKSRGRKGRKRKGGSEKVIENEDEVFQTCSERFRSCFNKNFETHL